MVTKYWRKYWQKQTIFSNFVQSKKALFPTEELNESCWSPMTGGGTVFDGYITHPPRGHSMHMSYSRKMIMSMTAAHILAKIGSTLMSVSCTRIRVARLDERTPNASITYGGRSYSSLWGDLDVLVDGAGLLDVGHLPDEGDGAEDGGEDGAGHVPRFLAVEVALQQPGERFLQQRFKVSQLLLQVSIFAVDMSFGKFSRIPKACTDDCWGHVALHVLSLTTFIVIWQKLQLRL